MHDPRRIFAERLKCLREDKRISQDKLSEKLNLYRTAIGGYESMDRFPTPETLCMIADYFNVSIDYLLGRNDEFKVPGLTTKEAKLIKGSLAKIERMVDGSIESNGGKPNG